MEEEEGARRCSGTQISALGIHPEHEKMLFHCGGGQALPGVESPPLEILWTCLDMVLGGPQQPQPPRDSATPLLP